MERRDIWIGASLSRIRCAHRATPARAAGKRARAAFDAHARAVCQGDGASAEDQLRAGAEKWCAVGWATARSAEPTHTEVVLLKRRGHASLCPPYARYSVDTSK